MSWTEGRKVSRSQWATKRRQVFALYGRTCHVCGKPGATEVDHVIPWSQGGSDELHNLRPIHPSPCHTERTREQITAAQKARARRRYRAPERHPGAID